MDTRFAPLRSTGSRLISTYTYLKKYWFIYMLILPGLVHLVIFRYMPMYGILVAFKKFQPLKGIWSSPWVGFKNFQLFFNDAYFYKVLLNTVLINIYGIVFGFTFTIFLALMINELKIGFLKKTVQTFVYLPHFLSWVIFSGLVMMVLSPSDGVVNKFIEAMGNEPVNFLAKPEYFRAILVISGIVKGAGFGTIIYLAAIAGINPELYESAIVDGAHRGHMIRHITLPRMYPTMAVLLIMNVANLFSSNFDQVYNLYNPLVYNTGDVISTYLYRTGLLEGKWEMATALGLVFNVLGLVIIIYTNKVINKLNVMGIF